MTKEMLARQLNGREYRDEITKKEEKEAKGSGLVVVFGASDDLIEFRGAIHDEAGCCYDGGTFLIDRKGILPDYENIDKEDEQAVRQYIARKDSGHVQTIEALWCKEAGYSWTYKTEIPHATFEIVEDGKPYCRGFVFSIADL